MASRKRYSPKPLQQTLSFEGKLIGCTDTAFAMCVDAETIGGVRVSEATVRGLSDEAHPDPNSPGLNLDQLEDVARKLHVGFTSQKGKGWAALVESLMTNHRLVAQLWYADLGGSKIGHAVYVEQLLSGKALIVDPMKGKPQWVPSATLRKAMLSFAVRAGVKGGGLFYGQTDRTPWIARNQTRQVAAP